MKPGRDPAALIGLILFMLLGFYLLSALYSPVETASKDFSHSLGQAVTGEVLGTADANGLFNGTAQWTPVKSGSETVYANGTASSSWTNCSYTITYATGVVNTSSSGTPSSCDNAKMTMDYAKQPQISNISGISDLPGVAVLLLVLLFVVGIIMATVRKTGM